MKTLTPLFAAALLALAATAAQAQSVMTDKADYEPGETVNFVGDGFASQEVVNLVASGASAIGQMVVNAQATADDTGTISGSFVLPSVYVPDYTLLAEGISSRITAQTEFTDKVTGALIIRQPSSAAPALACNSDVTFSVRAGKGANGNGNELGAIPVVWMVSGDVTATGSTTTGVDGITTFTVKAPAQNGKVFTVTAQSNEFDNTPPPAVWNATTSCAPLSQTITFDPLADKSYGNADFQVTALGGGSGNPVSFAGSGQCSLSDNGNSTATVSITGVGSCSITASQVGGNGYNAAASVTRSFSITKAAQTITFPQPAGTTYGSGPITLTATGGGSTSPVTFAYVSGPCSVVGDQASITGAGTCAVRASQAGDANYNAASNVDRSFAIAKADAVVSVTGFAGEYNGQPHGASGSAIGVLSEDLSNLLSLGATFTNVPGGTATWSFTGNGNYNATSGSVPITITKATASVDVTGGSFPYDGLAHAATVSTTPSASYTVTYDGSPTVPTNAGTYAILATVTDPNYQGTGTGSIEITKVDQTIMWAPPASIVYGTALSGTQLNATASGVTVGSAPGALVYSPASGAVLDAGTRTLRVDAAETTNYNPAFAEVTLEVAKADQAITFGPLATKTYGDADFLVSATSTSELPVAFDASGDCTVGGGTVHLTGAGSCTITATQAGNGNYNEADAAPQTFSIARRALTVTAAPQTKVYGEGDPALTYAVTSGSLVNGDALSGDLTRDAGEGVGSYPIQSSLSGGDNYDLTYVGANLSITVRSVTVTASGQTKVYGDADPDLTYAVTSGSLVSGDDFAGALSRASGDNVGTYAIGRGTLALSDNYALTFVGANLDITKKGASVTPAVASKTYGDGDPALDGALDGFLAGDGVTAAYSRTAGDNAGTYTISATLSPTGVLDNYDVTYNTAAFTIEKALLAVTADDQSKTYDGSPFSGFSVQYAGFVLGEDASVLGGPIGFGAAASAVNAGSYSITPSGLTSANYDITFVPATLTIGQRPVTVTADGQTKVYGNADPDLTYAITSGSLVSGDGFSGALTRAPGETVVGSPYAIGQGSLTLGVNYDLSVVEAGLSVTARPITVTADVQTKVYGDADPALTYTSSETLLPGNGFMGSLLRNAGEDVGPYAITGGDLTAGSNYEITFEGSTLSITARPVTVTAAPKSKVYGEADPALTYAVTGGSLAFSDAFSGALSRAAGNGVGTYAIGQGTLALSANYVLSYVGADLTVTPATLTVTADDASRVYGDTNPAFTATFTGFQYSEGLATSGVTGAPGLTTLADASSDVGTYEITAGLGTLTADNYAFSFAPSTLTVTPRPLTIAPTAGQSKVYGNGDPTLAYTSSEALLAGNSFSGALDRATGEGVGTYAIGLGGLSAGSNYALSLAATPVSFEVTARPVTVTAAPKSKVYGEADPALTYAVTGGSLAFSDAFTGALSRTAGETVAGGPYAIGQNTLTLGANYALTYVGADLTITKKAASVAPNTATKVYGSADPTLTGTLAGFLPADNVTAAYARTAGQNAGSYTIGATLSPADVLGNYDVTYNTAAFTIEKALLTVTAASYSRTFGYANPTFTGQITGFQYGENASVITGAPVYSTSATTLSPLGPYPITAAVSGMSATNYSFAGVSGTLTVTAFNHSDFLPPINTNGTRSAFKINSTVPAKFTLTNDAGAMVPGSIATASFTFARLTGTLSPSAELETISTETPSAGGDFRYSDGQWHFNWGTRGLQQGTYRIEAVLNDGTRITEFVELRK